MTNRLAFTLFALALAALAWDQWANDGIFTLFLLRGLVSLLDRLAFWH